MASRTSLLHHAFQSVLLFSLRERACSSAVFFPSQCLYPCHPSCVYFFSCSTQRNVLLMIFTHQEQGTDRLPSGGGVSCSVMAPHTHTPRPVFSRRSSALLLLLLLCGPVRVSVARRPGISGGGGGGGGDVAAPNTPIALRHDGPRRSHTSYSVQGASYGFVVDGSNIKAMNGIYGPRMVHPAVLLS